MSAKIYIAGKITGDPDYKAKFDAAAEVYKKKGYTVLNPSWMPQGMRPSDYMRICIAMIDTADVVAFLPGYERSAGAQLELQYCFYVDKDVKLPPLNSKEEKTMNRLKTEVHDILIDAVDNGIDDAGAVDFAIRTAAAVVEKVAAFVEKNGDISLSCGSEWLYQSDNGQVNALALVGDILDSLSDFASGEDRE